MKSRLAIVVRPRVVGILLLALSLAVALTAGVLLGQQHVAAQAGRVETDVWYVDWEATGSETGLTWEDAFVDLQDALDAAAEGEQIWVAAGTYLPSIEHGGTGDVRLKSFQMLNGVGIFGGFDPSFGDIGWGDRDWMANETVLSGNIGDPYSFLDNSYHVFYHDSTLGLTNSAILDGFTIRDGNADEWTGVEGVHEFGGGMFNLGASPALANCVFEANEAVEAGGGMFNKNASPVISDCIFRGNAVYWGDGGGLYNWLSTVMVEGSSFTENDAWLWGGGVMNYDSTATYSNCQFRDNTSWDSGAGMTNWSSSVTVTDSTFMGNDAADPDGFFGEGGGVLNSDSTVVMTNCTFALNHALFYGGGMATYGGPVSLTNCTFYGNVADDEGGALYSDSGAVVTVSNSILWEDTPDEIAGAPTVTYSDVQGGFPGEGNIDSDPLFLDEFNGDFHITDGSECIDAGNNDAPDLPPFDFEGDLRIIDGDSDGLSVVDMGVDEYIDTVSGLEATNDSPTPEGSTTTLMATVETGSLVEYTWYLGDGTYDAGPLVTHVYPEMGVYTAVVTATNPVSWQSATTLVTITAPNYLYYLPLLMSND